MKRLLIISLALNVLGILVFAGKRIYYSQTGSSDKQYAADWADHYNTMRSDVQKGLSIDSSSIVFVGTSITEGFPLYEMFPGLPIKNRGITSNRTSHLLGRIPGIAKAKPAKLFIEIGTNDISAGITLDSLMGNYTKIINQVKEISPRTKIYVQSIFPVCMENDHNNDSILFCNQRIKELSEKQGYRYLDVHARLQKNNHLDSTLTADGVHLNGKGYAIWAKAIEPSIYFNR